MDKSIKDSEFPQAGSRESLPDTSMASGLLWMHGVFFCLAAIVIGLSFLMRAEGSASVYLPGTSVAMPELCSSKRILGLPCPGCGLTRAFISISHGQFRRAWEFNATSLFVYPFVFVQIPWNAVQFWLIRKRGYGGTLPHVHFLPIAIAVILMLNWLVRLSFWQV